MPTMDPRAAEQFQRELLSGESIHWAAMPNPSVTFHSDDLFMIPFSLLWGGFAIFWEASAFGLWGISNRDAESHYGFGLIGIPFILIGQYMIWGRFVWDAYLKRRTYYAVTNRRVLIMQDAWKRHATFLFLESIPEVTREGGLRGTLWLGPKLPLFAGRSSRSRGMSQFSVNNNPPVLADIDDVYSVNDLILNLREKVRKE